MPVPLAPAVPTAVIVRVSWLAPVSTVIVSPTGKPVTLATRRTDGFGVAGVWTFWFQGAMPYAPAENAAGHAESSKAAVFQPAGGVAGVPASAFHVVSVTIRSPSSSSAPIRLPRAAGVGAPRPRSRSCPATSRDLMSTIWDVCQALLPPPDCATCWPLTYVTCESSALMRSCARRDGSPGRSTVNVLRT